MLVRRSLRLEGSLRRNRRRSLRLGRTLRLPWTGAIARVRRDYPARYAGALSAGLTALALSPGALPATLHLVDTTFDVPPAARLFLVDPPTGQMVLEADLDSSSAPYLALAALDATTFYITGTDARCGGGMQGCVLFKLLLTPPSTVPTLTPIAPITDAGTGDTIVGVTGLTFRSDGELYAISEDTDGLYVLDPETARATLIGISDIDLHGGDITFDGDGRLWCWTNIGSHSGIYQLDPATAAATLLQNQPYLSFSGLAALGHTNLMYGSSPVTDELYTLDPASGIVGFGIPVVFGDFSYNMNRGDLDSPFCDSDASCDDSNDCTDDTCRPGGCHHASIPDCCHSDQECDDGNPCTDDLCVARVCTHTNNTVSCDDGNACTKNDACLGGTCVGGAPRDCDDSNPCTDDSCLPASGCAHANNTAPCSDGNACTTADTCSGGTCVGGPARNCDDSNPCTNDSCVPASGCAHANNTASCSDGNACTTNDVCAGGSCVGGPAPNCDDSNPCTGDSCVPASGCAHQPLTGGGTSSCGVGGCHRTVNLCVAGVPQTCVPGAPAPSDATCDGVDDDCDGQTDEDFVSQPTTCGVGACVATGATSCVGGSVQDSCAPGASSVEVCDGLDNDCDGSVDEGLPDRDADGVCDGIDNCPSQANAGQQDLDGDGTGDACELTVTDPKSDDTLDCRIGAPAPVLAWTPAAYERFRVEISGLSDFSIKVTSGSTMLRASTWTPGSRKWKKVCAQAGESVHIRILGVDKDLAKGDPARKVYSAPVTVGVQH